jgi:hypothetical protein
MKWPRVTPLLAMGLAFILTSCTTPSVTINGSKARQVKAGDAAINFTVTLEKVNGPAVWSIDGPGTITSTGDTSAEYLPPAILSGTNPVPVNLTVNVGAISDKAVITVNPGSATGNTNAIWDTGSWDSGTWGP